MQPKTRQKTGAHEIRFLQFHEFHRPHRVEQGNLRHQKGAIRMKSKLNKNISYTVRPPKQLVHFEYEDATARKVCVAGTFNDWHPEVSDMIPLGSGKWVKDLELAPGTYEYRFVVDGKWTTDARCARTVPNAFGETNSLLVVPESPIAQRTRKKLPPTGASPRL
jgi:1,4-alpha-glucan branching enzyme